MTRDQQNAIWSRLVRANGRLRTEVIDADAEQVEAWLLDVYVGTRVVAGKTAWPEHEDVYVAAPHDSPLDTLADVKRACLDSTMEALQAAASRKWFARAMGPTHHSTLSTLSLLESRALRLYRAVRIVQGNTPWPALPPDLGAFE